MRVHLRCGNGGRGMESPQTSSAWSGLITSEDSGLIMTSGSLSSGLECLGSAGSVGSRELGVEGEEEESATEGEGEGCRAAGLGLSLPPAPLHLRPSSRLSSSHNSLSVPTPNRVDDSSFITSAMSHDNMLADIYNVPFDSDIYAIPVDSVRPRTAPRPKDKRRRRHTSVGTTDLARSLRKRPDPQPDRRSTSHFGQEKNNNCQGEADRSDDEGKSRVEEPTEPVHMTLQEVREFLQSLYSSGRGPGVAVGLVSAASGQSERAPRRKAAQPRSPPSPLPLPHNAVKRSLAYILKQALCNMFRVRKSSGKSRRSRKDGGGPSASHELPAAVLLLDVPSNGSQKGRFSERALPPLPDKPTVPTLTGGCTLHQDGHHNPSVDFAASIEKVKDCGWYWGPISGEAAEKILSNEPDGSFIVRDSSDHHYIFSLTFRLNGCVRHVRIEHDQGNFSFGSCTKFKSQTIVEFIETAVEHSRSGRYLFFLHRRPVLGPMRVQLLHPVSRFKHVQSLQHLARFVIVKSVRRDLLGALPLPRRLLDYLNSPHYYSEQLGDPGPPSSDSANSPSPPSPPSSIHLFPFAPPN